MGQYDAIIVTAHRLIAKYGEESSLIRSTAADPPDPNKPWKPGDATSTTYLVHTAWITESLLRRESLVKQGEFFAILAASDLAVVPDPTTDHIVRAGGARYAIISVDLLSPNGQQIIYEIRARL